jgi:hypothetical protein
MQENFSEIFSLTGAAFNYSAWQHPRRGRGNDSNTFSIENMTRTGLLLIVVI